MHVERPGAVATVPRRHVVHVVRPDDPVNDPISHQVHVDDATPVEYEPLVQRVQFHAPVVL